MNSHKILNPQLREAVAGMSISEIRELHLKLEQDVLQLQIFLETCHLGQAFESPAFFMFAPRRSDLKNN